MAKKARMCPNHAYRLPGPCIFKRAHGCPRNTNSKCEIIPAKPRHKRVKAWAWFWGIPGTIAGGLCANTLNHGAAKKFPCTILIEAKHLKGGKK